MKVIETGCAGFIGMHVSLKLLRGGEVVGIDNLNGYYDVGLKELRLKQLLAHPKFSIRKLDVADRTAVGEIFPKKLPAQVIHLAGQAGVRYSIVNPQAYVEANLVGFVNILEGCRHNQIDTWSMPAVRACMAVTPGCRSASMTTSIIPSVSMRRQKKPTN